MGPPMRAAELVALERLAICHKEIAGVELLIAKKLEEVAVERIRAALQRGHDHVRGVAELGRHVAGEHRELLNGIDVRNDQGSAQFEVRHGGAVERPAGKDVTLAIHR